MEFNHKKGLSGHTFPANWRSYQSQLKRQRRRRHTLKRLGLVLAALLLLITSGYGLRRGLNAVARLQPATTRETPKPPERKFWNRSQLQSLLGQETFLNRTDPHFEIQQGPRRFAGSTTLDPQLQHDLVTELNTWMAKERYCSRYVGVVVMDPANGKVLGFAGHDKLSPGTNPCLSNQFPAASIFKIVTAAAALESGNITRGTKLNYNGRPHTLYKSQLKDKHNKYTRYLTLQEAFAKSINPVFGKLGANRLGREKLAAYAEVFAFNQSIPWEFPLPASHFRINNEPYYWAEIASGFNQDTTLSPLHGAMITAAMVNGGALMVPNLVATLKDDQGNLVYLARHNKLKQAVTADTARAIMAMMEATITAGTGRKAFSGYRKDPVLARLRLGGKTGTINNAPRFDWYVGFARDRESNEQLAVAALVAHEEYIGQRAAQYAKLAIKSHFARYFMRQAAPTAPAAAGIPPQ